jgi:general secretion pathway protein A
MKAVIMKVAVLRNLLVASVVLTSVTSVKADSASDLQETGRLLAILLDSGRVTIGLNQALINNPARADQRFTTAAFASQTAAIFKQRTGIDIGHLSDASIPPMAKPLLERLMDESKSTVTSYQPVLGMPGMKYKGLIPATFGTETSDRFQKWSGVYLKQTAPSHLLRNPKNKPDEFETMHMEQLSRASVPRTGDAIVTETVDDGKTVRVLLPLFYSKACLSCHGEPKGERDISGYPREGAKEGDLGGVLSVRLSANQQGQPATQQPPVSP